MKDIIELLIELFERILKPIGLEWLSNEISIVLIGTCLISLFLFYLYKGIHIILKSRAIYKASNSIEYINNSELKFLSKYYIETQYQEKDPGYLDEPRDNQLTSSRRQLNKYIVRKILTGKVSGKYFLVLGDTGIGKTTFLLNLILRIKHKVTFFGLINQPDNLKFFPLALGDISDYISSIPIEEQLKTTLLLDALDENKEAVNDFKKEIKNLIEKTKHFKHIIITCRSQFFKSESDVPKYTHIKNPGLKKGLYKFNKFYISPFSDSEVKKFLKLKFPLLKLSTRKRAKEIVEISPDIFARPMLLNQIDLLLSLKPDEINIQNIYKTLIYQWIKRECRYKGELQNEYQKRLFKFCKDVALRIYETNESDLYSNFSLPIEEINLLAKKYDLIISEFEFSSHTLMNRNINNNYKFSHKSILEYFLAIDLYENENRMVNFNWKLYSFTKTVIQSLCNEFVEKNFNFYIINKMEVIQMLVSIAIYNDRPNDIYKLIIGLNISNTVNSCNYLTEVKKQLNEAEQSLANVGVNLKWAPDKKTFTYSKEGIPFAGFESRMYYLEGNLDTKNNIIDLNQKINDIKNIYET